MKTRWLPALSVIASLTLSSCFQSESTIHLNKDGSGKLIQEIRIGAQALAMMSGFGSGQDDLAPDPLAGLLSEEKARTDATKLGKGVTFEKAEAVNVNGAKGARITYRFTDINQLRLPMNEGMRKLMTQNPEVSTGNPADPNQSVMLAYADGMLTIKMPNPQQNGDAAIDSEPHSESDPAADEMMKQMLGDMKMNMRIVIEPGIATTNSSHHEGNTITLMEIDMRKLVDKPEQMKKISRIGQQNPAAALAALREIDGIKFETKPEITVTLK